MPAARLRPLRPRPAPYEGDVKPDPESSHSHTRSPSPPAIPTLAAALEAKPDVSKGKGGGAKAKGKAKAKAKAKGVKEPDNGGTAKSQESKDGMENKVGYDRALLVALVAKSAKPDYATLASHLGKTATQCRDIWRKVVFPALSAGREWSTGVREWDGAMKLHLAREVLATAKPDWEGVAASFPGRSPTQVRDIWRKVVLPRLMAGKALYEAAWKG